MMKAQKNFPYKISENFTKEKCWRPLLCALNFICCKQNLQLLLWKKISFVAMFNRFIAIAVTFKSQTNFDHVPTNVTESTFTFAVLGYKIFDHFPIHFLKFIFNLKNYRKRVTSTY